MNYITSDKILEFVKSLNNNKIKYIKTDFLKKRNKNIVKINGWRNMNETIDLNKVEVLITGHSDYSIGKDELDILNNNSLKVWFCENKNINHPKLKSIPIGITNYNEPNSCIHKIIGNTNRLYNISKKEKKIKNLVYLNITAKNYPQERKYIIDKYSKKKWVTYENPSLTENGHSNFLNNINNHKFIFAPRGNGFDTHRFWEALYLGTIPIVKKHISVEDFSDLPVLFVDTWDNITEEFLNEKFNEIKSKKYKMEKISVEYWKDKISYYF
jgi:hypothetical protein